MAHIGPLFLHSVTFRKTNPREACVTGKQEASTCVQVEEQHFQANHIPLQSNFLQQSSTEPSC